jgi:hypothetical protein
MRLSLLQELHLIFVARISHVILREQFAYVFVELKFTFPIVIVLLGSLFLVSIFGMDVVRLQLLLVNRWSVFDLNHRLIGCCVEAFISISIVRIMFSTFT